MFLRCHRSKDLIIARENVPLDSIISTAYPYLTDHDKISDRIEAIKDYAEDSLPVLNKDRRIIGIITAVSGHFCSECNRIRVTSTGKAKGCLFADEATDLIPWLRPPDREGLEKILKEVVMSKPERHGISQDGYHHKNFNMSQIGG